MKRLKLILLSLAVLAVNIGLDRITKIAAVRYLKDIAPISFLKSLVLITYAENSGAFLSVGAQWPSFVKMAVLLIVPVLICLYGIYWCLVKEKDVWRSVFLMSIIGGGLSNLFDRLTNDFRVIDFLNFGIGNLRTGILNVADLSVTFGAAFLIIYEYLDGKKSQRGGQV